MRTVIRPLYPVLQSIFCLIFLLAASTLFGQGDTSIVIQPILPLPEANIEPGVSLETLMHWTNWIMVALTAVFGWFSQVIPGINKIPEKYYQVAAIAVVLILVLVNIQGSELIGLIISFLLSTNLYDILKPLLVRNLKQPGKTG